MYIRTASLLIALLAAATACKKSEPPAKQAPATAVAQGGSGSATSASATGSADDPWSKPEAPKDPLKAPFLWSVEKDGITSYVLGTMHMGVDPDTRLPDLVWAKLEASKAFAMETDLAGAAQMDVLRKDGTTLRQDLGDEYWKKLEDAIGVAEASRLLGFKPMIPATLLATRGLPSTAPMDGVLHARAINQAKPVVFLETFDHQLAVLTKWMDVRALKDLLDDVPGLEQRSKEMLDAYIAGDAARVLAITESERERWVKKGRPMKEYDEQMDDMLYKRNASWIAPIEKLHAGGGGFIAVGALHALGPKSVLELLEKKGYKVTRLQP